MSSNLAVLIEAKRLIRTLGERISLPLKAKILSQTSVYSLGSFYMFSTLIKSISETQLNLQKATKGKAQVVLTKWRFYQSICFYIHLLNFFLGFLNLQNIRMMTPIHCFAIVYLTSAYFLMRVQYLKLLNMLKCWPLTLRTLRKTKPFAKKKMNEAHHLFWHVSRHLANGPVNVLLRQEAQCWLLCPNPMGDYFFNPHPFYITL